MTNLMLIPESLTTGFYSIGLDLLSLGAILSGILVITAKNPVISVLFLISLFVNIACYLVLLGISFIGLAYITVYVGAIAILFLFVIFLLDIKLAELQLEANLNNKNKKELPIGAIIGIAFLYPLSSLIPKNLSEMKSGSFSLFNWANSFIVLPNDQIEKEALLATEKSLSATFIWDGNFASFTQISSVGNVLYTNYFLWFFVSSLILLLAMVACISLTFKPSSTN